MKCPICQAEMRQTRRGATLTRRGPAYVCPRAEAEVARDDRGHRRRIAGAMHDRTRVYEAGGGAEMRGRTMTIDTDDMRKFRAEMERLRGAYIMDIAGACDMYAAALARAEAAEAEARRESNTAGEQFAVIARIGETLGIAMSTPNLCRVVQAEVETVKARAEAAEAERDDLRDECSRAEMAAIYFEARVAELEAQLGGDIQDDSRNGESGDPFWYGDSD